MQKLERAAQLLIDKQDVRRRAQAALVSAQHDEAQAGHELREALNALKPAHDVVVSNTVRVLLDSQRDPPPNGTPQPFDATQTLLRQFNGVRD
jgi:16S rRNA G1207 methylase RsmC